MQKIFILPSLTPENENMQLNDLYPEYEAALEQTRLTTCDDHHTLQES